MMTGTENSALARLLHSLSQRLSAELAAALVQLEADNATQARCEDLAAKCNEGQLTPAEEAELDSLVEANTLLGILKAQAELSLLERKAA
jgi:hypothetical protein